MTEIEDVDRISSLLDEILTHILSFLETKEAVATSVLSKRWEFIWTRVPVIDFSEVQIQPAVTDIYERSLLSLKTFVDRVLILNDAPFLLLFRLQFYEDIDMLHVCSWMRNIMRRNIFEIEVSCRTLRKKKTRLPKGSLVSETLKVLKLDGAGIDPWFPLSNLFLPKLLILHLETFDFIDDDVRLDDIFWSGLPCLEDFVISYCANLWSVCFCSSLLRRLKIHRILSELRSRTVIVDAPSLEYLSIDDNVSDIKLKIKAPSLVEAQFRVFGKSAIELVKILKRIPSLKTLDIIITTDLFDHFAAKLDGSIVNQLPIFHQLTCLDVSSWLYKQHPLHLTMLVLLCEHAPNLVSLIYGGSTDPLPYLSIQSSLILSKRMTKKREMWTPEWEREELWAPECEMEEPSDLPPTLVPKCLSSTLKVIDIYSYQMIDHAVTKYLLQYAMVLEIIRIHLETYTPKAADAISRLMKIPTASSAYKIVICRDL